MSDTVVVAERRGLGWQGILSIISVSLVGLLIAFLLGFAAGHCGHRHHHGFGGGPMGMGMHGGNGGFHRFGGGFGREEAGPFHSPWAMHPPLTPPAPAPDAAKPAAK